MVAALRAYLLLLLPWVLAGWILPPPDPVQCSVGGRLNCTVTNTHGSFNDRKPCRAAEAAYPRTEAELVAAVARAVRERRKAKAATKHSHSFPKLACPGGGRDGDGTVISTARLDRVVRVDAARRRITVESGVLLRELIREAAAARMALPCSPNIYGVSVGGLLATGAHGSSLMGKGGAVHEYVVGLRIVTPAPHGSEKLAVVRELGEDDPDLNAAKVSLGVLGVVSQVTLQLEPLFKRSVTFVKKESDADLAELVATWGRRHEFGEIMWMPGQGTVVLRMDDRVDVSTPGDGANNNYGPRPIADIIRDQEEEDRLQEEGSDDAICRASRARLTSNELQGFGFTNDGESFTGYPIVGYQYRIQASGACLGGGVPGEEEEDAGPESACVWDPRIHGTFIHNPGFSVALSNATAFVRDLLRLRDRNGREAFCGLDMHGGVLFRYTKRSAAAYLGGHGEDSVNLDTSYYRSRVEGGRPAAHADAFDEMEQMALYKYGALPHWGKGRNYFFNDTAERFPRLREFLDVKARFDPDGVFSSEWSDQVLGVVEGSPVVMGPGCAVDGLCTCTEDAHCAPGYVCSSGKVYPEARVCSAAAQPQGASTAKM